MAVLNDSPCISRKQHQNKKNMDPADIWRVIGTYTKGYFYLWKFPIHFNTSDKQFLHSRRSSIFFTVWKWAFGSSILIVFLATIVILLWLNFSTVRLLQSTKIVICFFILILCIFGLSAYTGIVNWMESFTECCNELSKGFQVLSKGRQY